MQKPPQPSHVDIASEPASAAGQPARANGKARRGGSWWGWLACFLAGAIVGGAIAHFGLQSSAQHAAQAKILGYQQDVAALRGRLDLSDKQSAALEGRLLIEESTRRGLETSLRQLQEELGHAKDTLAFYEQLMPPGPKGAISIRALDIERLGPNLRYRLLLMRSGSSGQPFQGKLQFVASGLLQGEPASLTLSPQLVPPAGQGAASVADQATAPDAGSEPDFLDVGFSDFQRSSGVLVVPPDFEPEAVTVNVLEGQKLRVSRSVELTAPQ